MELSKQQFIDRFTDAEFLGVLAAAKTDVAVEAWLFRFNNAENPLDTLDPRTIAGVQLMVAKGLVTQDRADEILGSVQSWNGWYLGQNVRVLEPFTSAYPDEYQIAMIDPSGGTLTINNGISFAPAYLEAV